MNEQKFVEVKVGVPVQIAEWLRAFDLDLREWVEKAVLYEFGGDLDAFYTDPDVFMAEKLNPLLERLREVPYLAKNYANILEDP